MKKNNWSRLAAVVALSAFSVVTFASGSDAVGAGQTGVGAEYNLGKRVYATKIACDSCPMAGKVLDKAMAEKIVMGGAGVELTEKEQKALTTYVKRRFDM